MNIKHIGLTLALCGVAFAATAVAAQHHWRSPGSSRAGTIRPSLVRPQALTGSSAGMYCPDMSEGAVGVQDLGWIPAGFNVTVNVESYSDNAFDPVAAVLVASVGAPAANSVKVTTFYDNDSGGNKDAMVTFVAPQSGTYLLLVTDYPGTSGGCYRYGVDIR